ncbi:hypothetical protein [Dyadobacter sp. CY356]|uniref:hypothetical protein n=1 Tax=Dyadobacter sp. CY356 TaxID=2906442 RepID=UPI001F1AE218|nr:hypothetical protein [Dyadobacter sp. CY356]
MIDNFSIKALWSDDQVRLTDFSKFLSEYFDKKDSIYYKILNENTFSKAKTDGRTVYWENVAEMLDTDGKLIPAPLDFCPDVLFDKSVLLD